MARKKVISKKDSYQKIKEAVSKQNKQITDSITGTALAERAGGSINNLPVKTKEFKGWLEAHQSTNPFIGKHVTAAPEYFTEEKKISEDIVDANDCNLNINGVNVNPLSDNNVKFDPSDDSGPKVEDLGGALKGDDKHDKKFIDISIIENTTKRLLTSESSDIIDEAKNALKSYHSDPQYDTEMNIEKIIEEHKVMLLTNQNNDKKLLK